MARTKEFDPDAALRAALELFWRRGAAVSALTRAAALDHVQDGVRINAVSPGSTATAMSLRSGESEAERAVRMKDESPLGRVSTTGEVAAAVLYLASADAASVVGSDLVIDAGASA